MSGASGSTLAPSSRGLSGGVAAACWRIPYSELTIIRAIGEGSCGRVHLAEWHSTPVAVKVLIGDSSQAADDATASDGWGSAAAVASPLLSRMESEAELMLSLRHPNIVQIMVRVWGGCSSSCRWGGGCRPAGRQSSSRASPTRPPMLARMQGVCAVPPCIVCEFCERGSVTEVLRQARTDPAADRELTWARRLIMALDAAKVGCRGRPEGRQGWPDGSPNCRGPCTDSLPARCSPVPPAGHAVPAHALPAGAAQARE